MDMWKPWIGSNITKSPVLLLGESCYDWIDGGQIHQPNDDHPTLIVQEAIAAPAGGAATMVKLTRALAKCGNPNSEQAAEGWSKVAFTNYVPTSVGFGASQRPSNEAWKQAEEQLPKLLEELNPCAVIVLGLEMWKRMPQTQTVVSDTLQGYKLKNNKTSLCYTIAHPASRGAPSWQFYADFISAVLVSHSTTRRSPPV